MYLFIFFVYCCNSPMYVLQINNILRLYGNVGNAPYYIILSNKNTSLNYYTLEHLINKKKNKTFQIAYFYLFIHNMILICDCCYIIGKQIYGYLRFLK